MALSSCFPVTIQLNLPAACRRVRLGVGFPAVAFWVAFDGPPVGVYHVVPDVPEATHGTNDRERRRKSHSGLRARLGGCGAACAGFGLFCRFHVRNMPHRYKYRKGFVCIFLPLASRQAFIRRSPHAKKSPRTATCGAGGGAGGRITARNLGGYRLQLASSFWHTAAWLASILIC